MSLGDLAFDSSATDAVKIQQLEEKVIELNRILASQNEDKYSSKIKIATEKLSLDEMQLEAFSTDGQMFTKVMVSKHADSDYVNIAFVPNEGKVLRVHMTEKSYMKFWEAIDVFKLKSINTRQFEDN